MLKRIMLCTLMLMLFLAGARAEDLPDTVQKMMPAGAEIENREEMGGMQMLTLSIPETGEKLVLAWNAGGVLFVETQLAAASAADAAPMERSRAEELVRAAYPDCRILFAEDTPEGKRLAVAGDSFCGSIIAADGKICSRSLTAGEIYRDGRLTMEGALQVLSLHRPEAEFRALELEEDDGVLMYEGKALLDGDVYEFELDVSSGKLLEWDRD